MSLKLTVDFQPASQLATRLERAAARGRLAIAAVDAVNLVTKRAETSTREGALRDINLTPAYVKSKTDVSLASPGSKPRAEILTKGDLTILGRFAPLSRVVAPGAARRAGPVKGFRSAGTKVAVRKSKYAMEPQWFLMRLRAGNAPGENFGVFVRDDSLPGKNGPNASLAGGRHRDGKAGKRQIYGPSPYALFREQIALQAGDITDDLRLTATRLMGDELEGAL